MGVAARLTSATTWVAELPPISAQTRLLVVAPHPDDETIATGLLIQQVRAAGGEVRILLLTAGDNNPWPQRWLEHRVRIGAAERERWGRRRHAEILQALQRLDVPSRALQSLGWPDMGVTGQLIQTEGAAVATVAAAISEFCPSLVAAPALDDRHPDHSAAHVLVRLALLGHRHQPQLLSYLVHGRWADANLVDIRGTAAAVAGKQAALAEHRSQMALSGNRMRHLAGRPECFAMLPPAQERASSALPWRPSRWLQPRLRLSVVSAGEVHNWRWQDAPLRRDDRGVYHLLPLTGSSDTPRFAKLTLDLPTLWIFDHWGWCELPA